MQPSRFASTALQLRPQSRVHAQIQIQIPMSSRCQSDALCSDNHSCSAHTVDNQSIAHSREVCAHALLRSVLVCCLCGCAVYPSMLALLLLCSHQSREPHLRMLYYLLLLVASLLARVS